MLFRSRSASLFHPSKKLNLPRQRRGTYYTVLRNAEHLLIIIILLHHYPQHMQQHKNKSLYYMCKTTTARTPQYSCSRGYYVTTVSCGCTGYQPCALLFPHIHTSPCHPRKKRRHYSHNFVTITIVCIHIYHGGGEQARRQHSIHILCEWRRSGHIADYSTSTLYICIHCMEHVCTYVGTDDIYTMYSMVYRMSIIKGVLRRACHHLTGQAGWHVHRNTDITTFAVMSMYILYVPRAVRSTALNSLRGRSERAFPLRR